MDKQGLFQTTVATVAIFICVAPLQAETQDAKAQVQANEAIAVVGARQINPTSIEFLLTGKRRMTLDFYGDSLFRWFRDDQGGILRDPESDPMARILVDQPRAKVSHLELAEKDGKFLITTGKIRVGIDRKTAAVEVVRLSDQAVLIEQAAEPRLTANQVTLTFKDHPDEYFYGGGVQNGRFSHKGKIIAIENQNSWTDGGVASPNPFYWSTRGYGIMWHTFKKGRYDFGSDGSGKVTVSHDTNYLDVFVMAGETPGDLLNDYYQLTGNPVLLPKFGFYLGHLNAYNRDYWAETEGGTLFEDGKHYKESQKENGGSKESLNGEKDNYQFSARAAIDRYAKNDMPLGWFLPNDGYGAGYGQTDTLEDNVGNLRQLGDYAREHGVEIGLWTQSDLHPKPEVPPLLQRDLVQEVRDAGVRVLKTDVAWVGAGYSFGLNGVSDASEMMTYYGNDSRPFIISLDGWAGTQRYAGVWTGDQTGGQWEYIRFHIPTYIGAGLSGMSNICSDMDGIFGGKNPVVNTRDYQWKTFTTMQLNMDGWGANPKYPQALGEPTTSINRWYLKMKSELIPYTYSIAHQSVNGLPVVRAMFLDEANAHTLGTATRFQYLYGPSILVAPIYQATRADEQGNDLRNNIYLPEGEWIDRFNGDLIEGGRIINHYESPVWKLPVFIKRGAIIPKAAPHNNVKELARDQRIYEFYPHARSAFTEYNDDGRTEQYKRGVGVTTLVESVLDADQRATLTIHPTEGDFDGFVKTKSTELQVNLTEKPAKVAATVSGQSVELREARSLDELNKGGNLYFYDAKPELNRFATPGSEFAKLEISGNPVMHIKLAPVDTTKEQIQVTIEGYRYAPKPPFLAAGGPLAIPEARITDENTGPYSMTPSWNAVANADYYEIEFKGMLYSTIREPSFLFEDLTAETQYSFKLRAVNKDGVSDWAQLSATTKSNPYQFAIQGIIARSSVPAQGGSSFENLVDHDPSTTWHTKWGTEAVPFEFTLDLKSVYVLDKIQYLPRDGAGNGTLLKGSISYSVNGTDWTKAGDFTWERDDKTKEFVFKDAPTAAHLKLEITEGVGKFGSGKELYIFKVPGSESYIQGDINADNKIDDNDLTSYNNYTGLRKGDSDFEGYISKGDINRNELIDAYDISLVATELNGGAKPAAEAEPVAGELTLSTPKNDYKSGETIEITVAGKDLKSVNAFSFALPYDVKDLTFSGIEAVGMKSMQEFTKDRLHTSGTQALYPTFVNVGEQEPINGSDKLFLIRFTAKHDLTFGLKPQDGILVDKGLVSKTLWIK